MRTLKLLSLLGWAWLSGCAHGPSSSNLATALPTASFVGVGVAPFPDIIGLELPASYDEDFGWPVEPVATSQVERAALAVNANAIKASHVGEVPGAVTWNLVEVWKDPITCDLTLLACDATRCESNVLVELAQIYMLPGESKEAVVRRFETRGRELWIELDLSYHAETRDVDCGTPCEAGDEGGEDCPPDDCGPIWEWESWRGSAVFARVYNGKISGWNALTSSWTDGGSASEANHPLPANPKFEPGGHWIGARPVHFVK